MSVDLPPHGAVRRRGRARRPIALVAFVALAIAHTWPLARDPAHLSRVDASDALLNTWAIAWVAHQLPRDPRHLFDANIFYPERLTLGYSEAMIVQGVLAMPIIAATGSAVLAYNLVLIAGFALTGWAFCLLVHAWTGSWAAGYTGGSLAAFNSHVLVRLAHLQTQHVEFIAIVLFALDRLIASRRVRDAILLGGAFALQGLTSIYLLVFTTWMLIFGVLGRARDCLRRDPGRIILLFAAAGAFAALLMAPYLLGYYEIHRLTGFERTAADVGEYAGSWVDYLNTGSRLHFALWSERFARGTASTNFPGVLALTLVTLAIAWPETRLDRRVQMCVAMAIGCVVVSILPNMPFYPLLHRAIPLFRAVRVVAHIGQIVLLMVAVVAGFGVAGLARRWRNPRTWPVVAIAICALVNLEALRAPLDYTPYTGVPRVYDSLAHAPGAVVIELPFWPSRDFFRNAPYMLNSTRHWRPIVNGYSGFKPASYDDAYDAVQDFPAVASVAALYARGVTHVVVHQESFSGIFGRDRFQAITRSPSLRLVAEEGDIHIYRIVP